jgi:hypothetical protein
MFWCIITRRLLSTIFLYLNGDAIMQWTKRDLHILKTQYGKIKIEQLELLLSNHKRQAIQKKAQVIGIKGNQTVAQRLYDRDDNFFDKPSVRNCYWAGFIAADGCVGQKDNNIKLCISAKDKEIIENFKTHTQYTGPLSSYVIAKTGYRYVAININGMDKWIKNLSKFWNIIPNKSLVLQPPNLHKKSHICAYIIGYFDGDGSAFFTKQSFFKNRFNMTFCGTLDMCKWIQKQIYLFLPKLKQWAIPKIHYNGHSKVNYEIRWTGPAAQMIHKYLNNVVNIPWKLKRKWEKITY